MIVPREVTNVNIGLLSRKVVRILVYNTIHKYCFLEEKIRIKLATTLKRMMALSYTLFKNTSGSNIQVLHMQTNNLPKSNPRKVAV
jgi:hypothetical protein